MMQLVLEYVFEGYKRGYNFTSPTQGLDDETLKTIWRTAMPRGQGWGVDLYTGARSLKCFPLDDRIYALSEVVVTDQQDDGGRRGIRRAVINLMTVEACLKHLSERFDNFPAVIHQRLERKPTMNQWRQMVDKAMPRYGRQAQVVLSHPFTATEDWLLVEALIIKLVICRPGLTKRWGKIPPFTTLALDYREESRIVALPAQQTRQMHDISIIPV